MLRQSGDLYTQAYRLRGDSMTEPLTEKEFDKQVRELCDIYGWRRYHTFNARHSPAGFPDLVLVRDGRLIFAELKSEKGKHTLEQLEWLDALFSVGLGVEVYTWRPSQLQEIADLLA